MLHRISKQWWLAASLALLGAACSCSPKSNSGPGAGAADGGAEQSTEIQNGNAKVTGTVLDAASGMPVGGAAIEAFGKSCKSGADGRFVLTQLPEGRKGVLRAKASGGRSAENALQPLRPGGLEVVLHLTAP